MKIERTSLAYRVVAAILGAILASCFAFFVVGLLDQQGGPAKFGVLYDFFSHARWGVLLVVPVMAVFSDFTGHPKPL